MDFQHLIDTRNATNAFANYLGLKIVDIQEGYSKCEMPINDNMKNPINSVHGGVLFTIADVAAGAAAASHGEKITTLDSSFHYLRAGLNTTALCAEAFEIKGGKNILVYNVKVYDQDMKVLCEGTFTYMSAA